jgi:hypothetical protein
MKPTLGHKYSRREISQMIGGSMVAYLPYRDGEILCGCFNQSRRYNPEAPEEVLYGKAPIVEQTAKMVFQQRTSIPIFLFRGSARWQYVGEYVCVGLSQEPSLLRNKMKAYPERGEIAGILYFRKEGIDSSTN